MKAIGLQCAVCGQMYSLEDRYECQTCGGLLQVIYEKSAGGAVPAEELTDDAFSGLWRYHRMLPLENTEHIVSLGEGNTPLVRAGRIYSGLGMDNFYIKNEFSNPTASFKDRPTSVGISVAKGMGPRPLRWLRPAMPACPWRPTRQKPACAVWPACRRRRLPERWAS